MSARFVWPLGPLVLLAGCGGDARFAPASGVVLLNGKPLANASVFFEPIVPPEQTFGPGSHAITGADGRFRLRVAAQKVDGALIGRHTVRISLGDMPKGDPTGAHLTRELLPARYNSKSELTFEVPPGGTDAAKFELKSP